MVKLNKEDKLQMHAEEAAKEETTKATAIKSEKKESKKAEKKDEKIVTKATIHDLEIVLYPLVTEKAVNLIEAENKITFIVADKADKPSIKKVVETAYSVKVAKINIIRDRKGRKKAIVKLKKEFKAQDLATKLKVL